MRKMILIKATGLGILTVCLLHEPGLTFTSCPPLINSIASQNSTTAPLCVTGHYGITTSVMTNLGFSFPWNAISRVADADIGVDIDEVSFVTTLKDSEAYGKAILAPGGFYNPAHHFDHPPGLAHPLGITEDQQAFINARSYVIQEMNRIGGLIGTGKCTQFGLALDAMGRALHAIQDVYSHSNYVDAGFDPANLTAFQQDIDAAVLDPSVQPPMSLKLTVFSPVAPGADPEDPLGTCLTLPNSYYCHLLWSKDSPGKDPISGSLTNNFALYNGAVQGAQSATVKFLNKIRDMVGHFTFDNAMAAYNGAGSCTAIQPPCAQQSSACGPTTISGQVITSGDPNQKAGSQGVGPQQYISGSTPLRYAIQFANEPTATASAQKVSITDQLDKTNDSLATLSLGPISFGTQLLTPPPLQRTYSTTVDLRPSANLLVAVNANLNTTTGLLTWNFQSLDPTTNQPPSDPTAGFLPPGASGGVFFTVNPNQGLPTNTPIQNQATIVFDVNAPINTPTWLNTLDNTPPTSQVTALPATETTAGFTVKWTGSDIGSGIGTFTVYVSDNGGPFTAFQTNTTAASATFTGQAGHTYGYYSIATDAVGNVEPAKTVAEATTTVASAVVLSAVQISTTASGLAYSRVSKTFNGTVTIKNISTSTLNGPFQIVFTSLPNGVTVANATGMFNGSPYLTVPSVASLAAGQAATVNVQFSDPSNLKINFTPVIYSGSFN